MAAPSLPLPLSLSVGEVYLLMEVLWAWRGRQLYRETPDSLLSRPVMKRRDWMGEDRWIRSRCLAVTVLLDGGGRQRQLLGDSR